MILNKTIVNKKVLENTIGEYIVVIYQLNEDNTRSAIKCDYDSKMYVLDKDAEYDVLGAQHWFKIQNGRIV